MHGPTLKVLVVDDAPDVAAMLAAMLSIEPDLNVVGTLADAATLVQTVAELCPDVVLLDLTMPGKPPMEALAELKSSPHPLCRPRVLVYSGYDDPETAAMVKQAGACGLISKASDPAELAAAVRAAARA